MTFHRENHRKMVIDWDLYRYIYIYIYIDIDIDIDILVGGDWNMNFIFPYTGNNHPN